MLVQDTVAKIARKLREGVLLEQGSHNLLVYDDLSTLQRLFVESAMTFLPKNEILLLASQYQTADVIKYSLENSGIDVSKHLANGTLFVIDAQAGYQGADTRGTFKLAMSLRNRAIKEDRSGVTWLGDMGSFFAFDNIGELVDYELFCPKKYDDTLKTVCCYHKEDFNTLEKDRQDKLIRHHFKSIFVS